MYKCFFINLKDLEASFNYEAASIDEALEKSTSANWDLRYNRDSSAPSEQGMEGLVRTYRARKKKYLYLYIHERQ